MAISDHRILDVADGSVTFAWRDRADGNTEKTKTIPVGDFIGRFLLHVLPRARTARPRVGSNPIADARSRPRLRSTIRTELENILLEQGVDTIVLTGFSTNRCVGLTAIEAWERDFKVILAGDAILGTTLADGDLMLDYLKRAFQIEPVSNAAVKKIVSGQETRDEG